MLQQTLDALTGRKPEACPPTKEISQLQPPGDPTGFDNPITSESMLVTVLTWLSYLTDWKQTVEARRDQQIRTIREEAAAELQIRDRPVEECITSITKRIVEFAEASKELFAKGKTYKCSAGVVQLRKRPLSIDVDDPKGMVRRMQTSDAFQAVRQLAEGIEDFCPYFKVEVSLDKEGIKRAVKEGSLTVEQLEPLGITAHGLSDDDTKIDVKPHAYQQVNVAS